MPTLAQIEQDLTTALKAKDKIAADVLRGLKTRVTNERIAKGKNLSEEEITALIRSELKKRKEAVAAYEKGGRQELSQKENSEAVVLEKYLPAQLPEEEIAKLAEQVITENKFEAKDFGKAMGMLKAKAGAAVDGATLARVLKEKLK